jgi:hypothetical protein
LSFDFFLGVRDLLAGVGGLFLSVADLSRGVGDLSLGASVFARWDGRFLRRHLPISC